MTSYAQFLAKKRKAHQPSGFRVNSLNPALKPFQKHCVEWALRLGRAALWQDCGLGKTFQQLEWARHVADHTGKPVLILAPLAVSEQTVAEGDKFGYEVNLCRGAGDVSRGINVTNYEMLHAFDASIFSGVVLDESSILKSYSGATRNQIIEAFGRTPYRLACTATPSPNDYMELGNHSEFLGIMDRTGMLATFFNHDGGETSKWKLKGHAEKPFWQWMASWAVMVSNPSDMGFEEKGYVLPELRRHYHQVHTEAQEGFLFPVEAESLSERREARSESLDERLAKVAELANSDTDQWLVWGDLNAETDGAEEVVNGAIQVTGADSVEHKKKAMLGFARGDIRALVSKPKIAGFGMNWQNCHKMAFMALSDSYEMTYQAERRCWRFGQQHPVDVHVMMTDRDASVVRNVERKRKQAEEMTAAMVAAMKEAHAGR